MDTHDRHTLWAGIAHYRPGLVGAPPPTAEEHAAFAATPRGRFLAALRGLEGLYDPEVARARAAYARGFADPNRAPIASEVGYAIRVLGEIRVPDARRAIAALADILEDA